MSFVVATAADMQALGSRIGARLQAGDIVLLSGPLGAGKTTFTQGLARGLGVQGPITSPTFVIARRHRSLTDGPALLHVDAYRISSLAEVDDLDLDSDLQDAVLVAEWGEGKIDKLLGAHLLIEISRHSADEVRTVELRGIGSRWEQWVAELE